MIVVLLGPPGVGKGTQGQLLARERGWRVIATGDLVREALRSDTEIGRRAKTYYDAGELVPDSLILGMVRESLEKVDPQQGVIFDGFPRTEEQAAALDPVLGELGRGVDGLVVLEAPEDVVLRRLSGRRSCPGCGAVYNTYLAPPRQAERCDRCGTALTRRSDDEPETIKRRLAVFREQTKPVVAYYRRNGVEPRPVAADGTVEQVQLKIQETLDSLPHANERAHVGPEKSSSAATSSGTSGVGKR
ncbi:MAG: adenylate kinase [Gemmatimonadetes bacterium]|nr:adenylate kinase [Gemmatimonadota bacterium]